MKLKMLVVAMLVASGSAYAGTDKSTGEVCQGSTCNGGTVTVETTPNGYTVNVYNNVASGSISQADSGSSSAAGSIAQSSGGTGGSAAAASGGSGGGLGAERNSGQSTTQSIPRRQRIEVRSVGIAPDVSTNNTAPCRVAVGGGLALMGGAGSVFGSVLDEGCDVWRDVENLRKAGFDEAANSRMCDKPEIARHLAGCPQQETSKPQQGYVH